MLISFVGDRGLCLWDKAFVLRKITLPILVFSLEQLQQLCGLDTQR